MLALFVVALNKKPHNELSFVCHNSKCIFRKHTMESAICLELCSTLCKALIVSVLSAYFHKGVGKHQWFFKSKIVLWQFCCSLYFYNKNWWSQNFSKEKVTLLIISIELWNVLTSLGKKQGQSKISHEQLILMTYLS